MKALFTELRGAVLGTLVLAAVCCGLYPLLVYGFAQGGFPRQANGSLLRDSAGTVQGSELLAQAFTNAAYFYPRPSAAGNGYDAANSGGSNLGPTSQKLRDAVRDRGAAYRTENRLAETDAVPADAVTASGSGLDPHISPRNAHMQAARVARARGWSTDRAQALVEQFTEAPQLGVFGDARVNVLLLNRALDASTIGK